jgi:cytoskeletal protein RodZ
MPAEIGATLREARMRARIDVSEIEAQTKIRAKYLRALENEEWDLLPGPTFVKSFLRTYAQALNLDEKAILEEYRQHYERPNEADLQPIVPTSRQNQSGRKKSPPARGGARRGVSPPSRGYTIAIAGVSLVIVLLVIGLLTSGGGSSNNKTPTTAAHSTTTPRRRTHHTSTGSSTGTTPAQSSILALSVQPTAPVYVCLISAAGTKLIPGLILQPGSTQPTYHSHSFTITLGNSSVKLFIDGSQRIVPPSSQAIGYSITKAGRHTLPAAQQPTCK